MRFLRLIAMCFFVIAVFGTACNQSPKWVDAPDPPAYNEQLPNKPEAEKTPPPQTTNTKPATGRFSGSEPG